MTRWLLPIALAACTGHGQSPPGGGDDDNPVADAGTSACGKESFVTGELVDWDSSTASFSGIEGATLTLLADPSITAVTGPGGALAICGRPDKPLEFSLAAPGDYPDGTISIERDAVQNGTLSLRAFTAARAASFFGERGLIFDPNKAQVVVDLVGDRFAMTLDRSHDAPQAASDDDGDGTFTWDAGDTGRYVLFPNVDATTATATIGGDPTGTKAVPIEAGKLSLVAISFVFIGP